MVKKKWIMANWKMNGSKGMLADYIASLNHYHKPKSEIEVVIFPPAIFLPYVEEHAQAGTFSWGGQNMGPEQSGAFTGEVSGLMLKAYGSRYVLVGHSERRHVFQESLNLIAKKFHLAKDCGMIPVICIGETFEEYQQGATLNVLRKQLQALSLDSIPDFNGCIIAYEPVWAIGSGLTPNQAEIQATLQAIQSLVSELGKTTEVPPILYGGSVSRSNIEMINEICECQGVLIGGASLKVEQFLEIIQCITCY